MKNNLKLPTGVDPIPFKNKIKNNLSNNLNPYLINSLSNMLALDYVNRLKGEAQIDEYAEKCALRLKAKLKHLVVIEEDFSSVMSLFAIAITDQDKVEDEIENQQEKDLDILVDNIINTHFNFLSPEERIGIKEVLKSLLKEKDRKEIINFINSDPQLFSDLVFKSCNDKNQLKEFTEKIKINLNKVITQAKSVNKSVNNVKSLVGRIATITTIALTAVVGVAIGGLALPLLLIPAVAVAVKIGPVIGEKIGENLTKNNSGIKDRQENLRKIISTILSPDLTQEQDILHTQQTEIKPQLINIKSENFKENSKKNIRER